MPFVPPSHTLYPWQDGRDPSITAQHLGAAEQGVVDHVDASVVALSDSVEAEIGTLGNLIPASTLNVLSGVGNLSGAYPLDMSANVTVAGVVTLTGDTVIVASNFDDGAQAKIVFRDGGGQVLSVQANEQTTTLVAPASGPFIVELIVMDSTVFARVETAAALLAAPVSLLWSGSIAPLVNGQLDTSVWPYQSVAAGHLAVLADPLGVQGTVLTVAITETG